MVLTGDQISAHDAEKAGPSCILSFEIAPMQSCLVFRYKSLYNI